MKTATPLFSVMTGLVPAIHALLQISKKKEKVWMPGSRPGMTTD